MVQNIEILQIDLKYEGHRLKSASRERALLSSIDERGIEEPVLGVRKAPHEKIVLMDGFKRFRCAKKLGHTELPFVSLGSDEAVGILQLIRTSNAKSLSFIEQAKLVDELRRTYQLSVSEIARQLGRSNQWVTVRVDAFSKMSEQVSREIFSGRFPLYSYLYTVRQCRRLAGVASKDVDRFVGSVSGKALSTREIELLAHGYFRGGPRLREQILNGNIAWCLSEMKARDKLQAGSQGELGEVERGVLRDLDVVSRVMGRLILKLSNPQIGKAAFFAEAGILTGGIIRIQDRFLTAIGELYARSRPT